ncbi:MAG: TolC family protein [Pirellulales bacterium]
MQNPSWRAQLGNYTTIDEDGAVHLTLDDAVQLSVIHDPDYRQQLEELYFSALDVSTERFRFDTQFFGGFNPIEYAHLSRNAPGAGGQTRDVLTADGYLQLQRQFAAGGELLVGFANSLVWQFAGPDTNQSTSLINFSFVQPLLRGGGRRFILETLTIVERAMLSNLRAFERFRQGFYTNLAVGDGGTTGAQRRGGFFGGTGLTGFTGQGSTGFGGVGDATGFGRAGGAANGGNGGVTSGFAGGGAGTLGGYVGLLQTTQQIRNQQQNLNAQLRTLKLLQANLEAGTIDIAQVDQFRQNIETGRATLLQSRIGLENTFETYKRQQIGLPPDLPMSLDDGMIRQFQFIAPATNDLYERLEDFVDELGNLPDEPDVDVLQMALDRLDGFRDQTAGNLATISRDLETLDSRLDARKQTLSSEESSLLDSDVEKVTANFAELQKFFQSGETQLEALRKQLGPATRKRTIDDLVVQAKTLASLVQESSLVQVRARLESITLDPIELDPQLALQIARANRYDWMNNRAALVDSWRLIAFNARSLLSTLDVTINGSLGTVGDNGVKFQSETGTLRAGLQFDAPFTRLVERNNYRSALIEYQRDRRQLIQYEDGVNQTLRQSLRTLAQLETNLEIQRRTVTIATRRVDQTREVLSKPPEPTVPGQAAAGLGPTAALNLLTALNDLQASQNNFMSVWLNHYAGRMLLMRELGLMQLDDRGIWIDVPLDQAIATAPRCPPEDLPPDVPQSWYDALERLPTADGEPLPKAEVQQQLNDLPVPIPPDAKVTPEEEAGTVPAPPTLPQPTPPQPMRNRFETPPAPMPPNAPRLVPPNNGSSANGKSGASPQVPPSARRKPTTNRTAGIDPTRPSYSNTVRAKQTDRTVRQASHEDELPLPRAPEPPQLLPAEPEAEPLPPSNGRAVRAMFGAPPIP